MKKSIIVNVATIVGLVMFFIGLVLQPAELVLLVGGAGAALFVWSINERERGQ